MNLAELQQETSSFQKRLAAADTIDAKLELADNFLPLFEALIEVVGATLGDHDEAIDDMGDAIDQLMDQTEDVLHADSAKKIMALVEVGKMVAKFLEKAQKKGLDDVTRAQAVKAIAAYRVLAKDVTELIMEITLPDTEDEPDAPPANGNAAPAPEADEDPDADGADAEAP